MSSLIHVDHCVYAAKFPLTDPQTPLQLDVSTPVTSLTNLPDAESGFTNNDEMPAIARFAISVSATSMSCFGMLIRYRRQYAKLSIDGGQGSPMGMWTE